LTLFTFPSRGERVSGTVSFSLLALETVPDPVSPLEEVVFGILLAMPIGGKSI